MRGQETLGGYLRALREEREGSLEEMSFTTRVSVVQLEALESDRLAELPAPVFVKGFIRAYCQFLDQPPDEALDRYRKLLGVSQPLERAVPRARPALSTSASAIVISLALLIVLGAGLLALRYGFSRPSAPRVAVTPAMKVEPVAKFSPPSETSPVAKVEPPTLVPVPASPAPRTAAGHRLTVKAIELTWLRIKTDDGTDAEALLPPGATREWTAERRFLLTVGNAGGVELTLNGRPMPPLGAKGTVIRGLELPRAGTASGS